MNPVNLELAAGLVDRAYIKQGGQARASREKMVRALLANRKLPEQGWDDQSIEFFLSELAMMDSNNFLGNIGVGEREGRVWSDLVARRHYRLSHGIGRSGDVQAVQPKAAGSSLLLKICTLMALDALQTAGLTETKGCLLLPVATGMAHVLTFLHLRSLRPKGRYVVWPRIDQQTCFKAIFTAGLVPLVVENQLEGQELRTDMKALQAAIASVGPDQILCVLSTSSCFAPRAPDRLEEIARLCKDLDVPHVVNNAYGVQCSAVCKLLSRAMRVGRVDAFIQSMDKNFMVPIGGAIVAGNNAKWLDGLAKSYPGRASASPILDLLCTLLSLGRAGWIRLLKEREENFVFLQESLSRLVQKDSHTATGDLCADLDKEQVLATPHNHISMALSLTSFGMSQDKRKGYTYLGSMLFSRNTSGPRVVDPSSVKTVAGVEFQGYSAHCNQYSVPYITIACAIGMTRSEGEQFLDRLQKCVLEFRKKQRAEGPGPTLHESNTPTPSTEKRPSQMIAVPIETKRLDSKCAQCSAPSPNFSCQGCLKLDYCSAECQSRHWKSFHKQMCDRGISKLKSGAKPKGRSQSNMDMHTYLQTRKPTHISVLAESTDSLPGLFISAASLHANLHKQLVNNLDSFAENSMHDKVPLGGTASTTSFSSLSRPASDSTLAGIDNNTPGPETVTRSVVGFSFKPFDGSSLAASASEPPSLGRGSPVQGVEPDGTEVTLKNPADDLSQVEKRLSASQSEKKLAVSQLGEKRSSGSSGSQVFDPRKPRRTNSTIPLTPGIGEPW
eukprot:gb/GEZN01001748.1/.p1 GENE.gb/GEZN01001748.1/~~gb/GEZN01001748.1/.p1  ORF type:complete len:783 (+),score=66.12 gb/GEZN01001748.1/:55-2403(+)